MKQIFTSLLLTCLVYGQFGNVKVVFDNDLLKAYEQQNVLPLKLDIANFIQSTRWDEEYSDLKIPLHIQFIFEGVAQKGAQETYMAQVLFSNGTDQRFFDKSFQFPYGQGGSLYFDLVLFDPLASFLAFYTNLILAGEMDTYEPFGGTRVYEISREIALRGIASEYSRGWADRARLVNDMSTNYGLRKAKYSYFYAMDLFKDGEMDDAVKEFGNMIKGLDEVYDRFSKEHYTTLFIRTHAKNLAKVLQLLGQKNMLKDMVELDPDNMELYQAAID
ncbi:MAG: DUF4835 family protein [Candidatus Marinimicrobia bacterium]|nr:DUF4835 family protein [Candidatus Neomarinimicrobiota bacterium]